MRCLPALLAIALTAACGENQTPPPSRARFEGDAAPLACAPDLDGTITSQELTPSVSVPVSYLLNPPGTERTVDLVGAVVGGRRTWNFGTDFADDQLLTVEAQPLVGKWFATSFPTGEVVVPLDAAGTLVGVYRHDDQGFFLLGIASKDEAPAEGKTLLVYEPPIAVFRFPLVAGAKWVSAGTVTNGTIRGLPYAGKDVYEVEDDATGKLVLHDFTFEQVHRIRTKVTVSPSAGAPTTKRQVSFVAECFGEVARVTSRPEEPNADFTAATELRRLGQ